MTRERKKAKRTNEEQVQPFATNNCRIGNRHHIYRNLN